MVHHLVACQSKNTDRAPGKVPTNKVAYITEPGERAILDYGMLLTAVAAVMAINEAGAGPADVDLVWNKVDLSKVEPIQRLRKKAVPVNKPLFS